MLRLRMPQLPLVRMQPMALAMVSKPAAKGRTATPMAAVKTAAAASVEAIAQLVAKWEISASNSLSFCKRR
ncbi:hypothetical protein D3C86_1921920 [compost metagenome]